MPELPEVQTTVNGINQRAKGQKIIDVWTDLAVAKPIKQFVGTLKDLAFYKKFKKLVAGAKIKKASRRGKNILIEISNDYTILIHMKMTGHMMYGSYDYDKNKNSWSVHKKEENHFLRDPFNRFIHFVISFTNGKHLVLSDTRKFAKVTLIKTNEIFASDHLKNHGPEPLEETFSLKDFKERLQRYKNRPIKIVLLDPSVIAGVGNIYGDELLWEASVHPLRKVADVTEKEFGLIFKAMKKVLQKGIDFGGDSMSDYRDIDGKRGTFQNAHNAYRLTGKPCKKKGCKGKIERVVVGARSAHFCNVHQK